MQSFIVYQGSKFTIEWYYDEKDRSPALAYFNALSTAQKKKFAYLITRMAEVGEIINEEKFRNEGDQIYAFKPASDRFLCLFFKGSKIIITNAFEKRTNKLPKGEKDKALQCKEDYINRVNKGTYYE